MKKVFGLVGIIIIAIIVVAVYYFYYYSSEVEQAKRECIKACQLALQTGQNLSSGPCLSNSIINNWICDVAHEPREPIDDLEENQCPAYLKTAQHFIEVDPNCNFIRAF